MQIEGEKVTAVTDFIFLGSKVTVDGDWSHEIKTCAPWKESYDKPTAYSKASFLQCSAFFMVHLSHLYMTTGKIMALTIQTFVSKVMSLLLNML